MWRYGALEAEGRKAMELWRYAVGEKVWKRAAGVQTWRHRGMKL